MVLGGVMPRRPLGAGWAGDLCLSSLFSRAEGDRGGVGEIRGRGYGKGVEVEMGKGMEVEMEMEKGMVGGWR